MWLFFHVKCPNGIKVENIKIRMPDGERTYIGWSRCIYNRKDGGYDVICSEIYFGSIVSENDRDKILAFTQMEIVGLGIYSNFYCKDTEKIEITDIHISHNDKNVYPEKTRLPFVICASECDFV